MNDIDILYESNKYSKRFFYYEIRRKVYTIHQLNRSSEADQKKILSGYLRSELLQNRIMIDPGFNRYIRKEIKKVSWTGNHQETLAVMIFVDLLLTKTASRKDISRVSKYLQQTGHNGLTSRQQDRIMRDYYPELFIDPHGSNDVSTHDHRESPYATVFSGLPPIESCGIELLDDLISLEKATKAVKLPQDHVEHAISIHTGIRLINPEEIEGVIEFHKFTKKIVQAIEDLDITIDEEHMGLAKSIREGTMLTEEFYYFTLMATIIRWFCKKSEQEQLNLLKGSHPYRLTKDDIKRSLQKNLEWQRGQPRSVVDYSIRGAYSLTRIGKPLIAIELLKETSKVYGIDQTDRALCHHHIGDIQRQGKHYKAALTAFLETCRSYNSINDELEVGVTNGFISEIYMYLEATKKSEKHWELAMSSIHKSQATVRYTAKCCLILSNCAIRMEDEKKDRQILEIGLEIASKLRDESYMKYFNERLLVLNSTADYQYYKKEIAKMKAPEIVETFSSGFGDFIPIVPGVNRHT